jgi:hypothetical protein
LGHAQACGGQGKAVLAHGFDEITQGSQVHDGGFGRGVDERSDEKNDLIGLF